MIAIHQMAWNTYFYINYAKNTFRRRPLKLAIVYFNAVLSFKFSRCLKYNKFAFINITSLIWSKSVQCSRDSETTLVQKMAEKVKNKSKQTS